MILESAMLLDSKRAQLLVVDVQERLFPHIDDAGTVRSNIEVLVTAALEMDIPVTLSEQYPKGLGPTIEPLMKYLGDVPRFEKMHFSCAVDPEILRRVRHLETASNRDQIVVVGIEAHVCVLQSALGFRGGGHHVAVVADGVGSRQPASRERALDRMAHAGIEIVTTEMVLFEWMHKAGTDQFRSLSKLIK
ncbi:MAG: hydrolase [Sphingomonadales bacterium]